MTATTDPRTVLITGGASGLGAATVRAVLDHGGRPLVLDRVAPVDDDRHPRAGSDAGRGRCQCRR